MISKRFICSALLGLTACGQSFPEAICERVNVTSNGKPVIGVEDMAYDAHTGTLYLSAYDRRAHSKGGIYRLAVESEGANLTAEAVVKNLRPHGMDITRTSTNEGSNLIINFIDRLGEQQDKNPIIRTLEWPQPKALNQALLPEAVEGAPYTGPKICASNDLVRRVDGTLFITQDHKSCTHKKQKRENIISPNQASVTIVNSKTIAPKSFLTNLSFANGIALSSRGETLYVAETRAKQITIFSSETREEKGRIKLAGGPDNLTRSGKDIYAALIPSLIRFSSYQKNSDKRIKSRFAIIIPDKKTETHKVTTYDVPASVISGATVAIKAGGYIWLGAGYDTAIARCTLPESAI